MALVKAPELGGFQKLLSAVADLLYLLIRKHVRRIYCFNFSCCSVDNSNISANISALAIPLDANTVAMAAVVTSSSFEAEQVGRIVPEDILDGAVAEPF